MSNVLDMYVKKWGNVVLRDSNGNPSIFVRHPKQKSNEFDPILPDHVHPAFIVGEDEDDAVLIGKYKSSELVSGGSTLYSLPNAPMPHERTNTYDTKLAKMRAFGNHVSGMTIADHGLLVLIEHMSKIRTEGNTNYGQSYFDGTLYTIGEAVTAGVERLCYGYRYTCLKDHTTSDDLLPFNAPGYWKKGERVGGTPSSAMAAQARVYTTLTGSGPLSWYFGHDIANEADLVGGGFENAYGFRIVNNELQFIPNNLAAENGDCGASSTEWRAILPHANDTGFDWVAPRTSGTVHYIWKNSKLTLAARALEQSEFTGGNRITVFKDIAIDADTMPNVPYVLYEYGIAPLPGTTVLGWVTIPFDGAEHICRVGCDTIGSPNAGIARMNFEYSRAADIAAMQCRARAREMAD